VYVLNFPSEDVYGRCADTICNNRWEMGEIAASGLTAERTALVNAPRIRECFLSLDCAYVWGKELVEGTDHTVLCLKVVNICIEEVHLNEATQGRYGKTDYLYNIHYPVAYAGKAHDYLVVLEKVRDMGKY